MNNFKDLTTGKLLAFNEVAKNVGMELEAAIFAFDIALDHNPETLEAFKQLKELNDFILEETFREHKRRTTENKFKDTDTQNQTETTK
jgi:hypothetical protein